jgi:hypothetical protein
MKPKQLITISDGVAGSSSALSILEKSSVVVSLRLSSLLSLSLLLLTLS